MTKRLIVLGCIDFSARMLKDNVFRRNDLSAETVTDKSGKNHLFS